MDNSNIIKYINILIKKIKNLNHYYYIKNISLISDKKYDLLLNKLYYIENKYPNLFKKYTSLININKYIKKKNKIYHITPMLSIKNTYNINNIFNFFNKIKKKIKINRLQLCCELKIDGIAINLLYKNGFLIEASTRGNGYIGENIINNINIIDGIPRFINYKNDDILEVRGEIFIYKNDLVNLNKLNNKNFSNERHAVSSLIRKKKINLENKYLKFFCYGIGYFKNNKILYHSQIINILKKFNFNKFENKYKLFYKYKRIKKYINYIIKNRNKIHYPIDGLVIKINSIKIQNLLSNNNYYPNYMLAFKFNINNIKSKILKINFNIDKHGKIIPIAEIEKIYIKGIIIKNINLYNINYIINNKININSIIYFDIIGEIIPKITKIINLKNIKLFDINLCPSCKVKLYIYKNKYICNSNYYECRLKFISYIKNFISYNAFNINGIGDNFIIKILDNNIIKKNYDIFNIKLNDLYNINIGKKKSLLIINNINKSKYINIFNFIYSLNIKEVGLKISIYLSKNIKNINDLFYINKNEPFLKNKIIKKNIYNNILTFFNNKNNIEEIKKLINHNIKIKYMGCTGIEPVTN